jgi:hypothetical protein
MFCVKGLTLPENNWQKIDKSLKYVDDKINSILGPKGKIIERFQRFLTETRDLRK